MSEHVLDIRKKFAYLHSSACNFMSSQSFFKNSGANNISGRPCIRFCVDNTAGDNGNSKYSQYFASAKKKYEYLDIVLF